MIVGYEVILYPLIYLFLLTHFKKKETLITYAERLQ